MVDNWRMTALAPRFIFVDARAALFIPPVFFYPRTVTLVAFLIVMVILAIIERRGYTVPVAMRMMRLFLSTGGSLPIRIYRKPQIDRWRDRKPL